MASQPSYKPLAPCALFPDGTVARPLVPGTVARGHLRTDTALFTGRRLKPGQSPGTFVTTDQIAASRQNAANGKVADENEKFVDAFPFPLTAEFVSHGRDRYEVFCVVCHDPLGTGRGKIVERGYTAPPSYHIPRLRQAPVGRLFAVISEGYGSMPSYRAQIPTRDRWAIVAYLRALQLSQRFPEPKLSAEMRAQWDRQRQLAAPGGAPP